MIVTRHGRDKSRHVSLRFENTDFRADRVPQARLTETQRLQHRPEVFLWCTAHELFSMHAYFPFFSLDTDYTRVSTEDRGYDLCILHIATFATALYAAILPRTQVLMLCARTSITARRDNVLPTRLERHGRLATLTSGTRATFRSQHALHDPPAA